MTTVPPAPRLEQEVVTELPAAFRDWFLRRGWELRAHQSALLRKMRQRRSTLLIAPTGSGKTLAGFLPSLVDLTCRSRDGRALHTLYVSPLKAAGRYRR
jgi:ATP-dependent Lhr-like helicase